MSLILEKFIRTYLIEGRTVAKLRNASAKDTASARAAGAVYAYNVLVKGTSDKNEILQLVKAATEASTGTSTDSREVVGDSSKFATIEYVYVVSDPLSKKRQTITVWILKSPFLAASSDESNAVFTASTRSFIGSAAMFTKSKYNEEIKKIDTPIKPVELKDLKSKETIIDKAAEKATDTIAGNKEVTDYELTRDGKVVGKFNGTINKNGKPVNGKAELTDGQWFDGTFKDGAFSSGTCRKILNNGDIFEGELKDGIPTDSTNQKLTIVATNNYFEGSVDSTYGALNGIVYSNSTKSTEIGKFINGEWQATDVFTNQQIIDATKSSKYSDATKYFQQLMVDKIATKPKVVAVMGDAYTKVKDGVDGKWGNNSKTLMQWVQAGLKLPKTNSVTDEFIEEIKNFEKRIIESILNIKNVLLEQFDFDAVEQEKQKTKTTPTPSPAPKPKPGPTPPAPKPTPTPKIQNTITDKTYVLKKDHDITYVNGSADSFLKNMKQWLNGAYRKIGGGAIEIYKDSVRGKWFDKKSITIPKGTKVYIHPDKIVMFVTDTNTPDGNIWRITYFYKDKTLSTSSYYTLWRDLYKKYISYPAFENIADRLDIDNISYVSPKYRNDELIGFLRTLSPDVQTKKQRIKNLTKEEKQQLNKDFDLCINIAKDFWEIFGKNPQKYFGKYKGSSWIPWDQDLNKALLYLQDAVQEAYVEDFKRLSKSSNLEIRDNAKKLHDVYLGVQEYLRDLIRTGSSNRPTLFKFKLIHPFNAKRNTKVTIPFTYFE